MWHIDNSVHLRSCIRNVNKHLWCRCQGESQYLISIYRLHGIILCSLISLTDLSAALWLFMVFIGKYRSRLSSPGSFGSHIQEIVNKFHGSPPPHEPTPMAAQKCINDFSAPSSANVRTGPETNIRAGSFKHKWALINLVQQSPFCGKASEDPNAHL
jgi:hypothetical protein